MSRFTFALYFSFIASLLSTGCTTSTYLMNTPEPLPEKEIKQALESWKGTHISEAIQKWGSPHGINGNEVGPKIYIWQLSVQTFLPQQEHQPLSLKHPNGVSSVPDTSLSTNDMLYELVFYTRSNGTIYKTFTKRSQNSMHEPKWKEKHISKAIQKWGTPHGITDDGTDSKIYIWQIPVQTFLPQQEHQLLSVRPPNRMPSVQGTFLSTNDMYELMFYTRSNGTIYKTFTKRDQNPSIDSRSFRFSQEKPGSTR